MSVNVDATNVPTQVEEAADLAEQLFEKMYGKHEEEEVKEEDSTPVNEDIDEDSDEDDEDEEEEEEIDPKELKKWRDRYLTLKGKYDAEVPRLASQVRELMEKATAPKAEPAKADPDVEEVDDFEAVYGKDFVEKIRKVINDTVKNEIKPVAEKVDSVEDSQNNAATESFKAYLDEAAEGWRDLWEGKDKGFNKFLDKPDPSGLYTYGELLETYNKAWDADRMAKIFKLYTESKSTKSTKPEIAPEQEAMIAPSRTKANNAPTSNEKRIWTEASMKEFEIEDRNGKYSDEESQKIWADLLAAAHEGRIRR